MYQTQQINYLIEEIRTLSIELKSMGLIESEAPYLRISESQDLFDNIKIALRMVERQGKSKNQLDIKLLKAILEGFQAMYPGAEYNLQAQEKEVLMAQINSAVCRRMKKCQELLISLDGAEKIAAISHALNTAAQLKIESLQAA